MFTSRRAVLGLGLGVVGTAGACSSASPGRPGSSAARVMVVGAGMSGLAAARTLHDHGVDVTVIEARPRIGGRVWTSTSWAGTPLDLGASWIHGTQGNPLTDLAHAAGAATVATDTDSAAMYTWHGGRASEEDENAVERWTRELSATLRTAADADGPDLSVSAALQARIGSVALDATEQAYRDFALNELEHEYAGASSELSARYLDSDAQLNGDDVLFPGGYGQLTDHLARGLSISIGDPVTDIGWDSRSVTVTSAAATRTADRVLVTLPLGVLKAGSVRFGGPLPDTTLTAMDALGVGVLNKCYLEFPDVFWEDRDWLTYLPAAGNEGLWTQWVNLARPTGKPVLLGFNAALVGAQLEAASDEDTVAGALRVLRTMVARDIPDPTRFLLTRWHSDPYARGSYSFARVGSTPAMRADLARDLDQRVFFAGEATSASSPGTVRGAYESGLRAAQSILDLS